MAVLRAVLLAWSVMGTAAQREPDDPLREEPGDDPGAQLSEEVLKKMFAKIDMDKDGKIPIKEFHMFAIDMRHGQANNMTTTLWGEPGNMTTLFGDMDKDRNGKISLEEAIADDFIGEWKNHEKMKFKAADKDGDGSLDDKEFVTFQWPETDEVVEEAWAASIFTSKDKNNDGKLTSAEMFQHDGSMEEEYREDFNKLDANGDGTLDVPEIQAWESGRQPIIDAMEWLHDHADANKDGSVTVEEFVNAAEGMRYQNAGYHMVEWAEHLEL